MLIFPVLSEIKVVKIRNKLETDSILSNNVRTEIIKQVKTMVPDNIRTTQLESNEIQQQEIYRALAKVIGVAESKFKPKVIKAPDLLLRLLDSTKQDLGLCILSQGFIRTDENQSKEYTKSMLLNVFTLGIYALVPNKSFSTMVCLVIDRKQKTVLFYDRSMWRERNPTEQIVIKSQLYHLLMSYFNAEKSL
jgi:hypothetical protein